MKKKIARKIAIDALVEKRRRLYAFGHGMYELGLDDYSSKRDHAHYVRLTEAIEILDEEEPVQMTLKEVTA